MVILGVLGFLAAETAAFVIVGEHIGFAWATVLLIAVSALGPLLVKRVGVGAVERTRGGLARGELPTRELLDGVVMLAGGVMISVPGFVSDAVGLLLMIGPVRHLLIAVGGRRVARRVQTFRPARWRAVDARSRPAPGRGRPRSQPPSDLPPPAG